MPPSSLPRIPKTANVRHSRSGRVAGSAGATAPEASDAVGHSSRSGAQQPAKDGSIHLFFEQRQDRRPPASPDLHGAVEATDGDLCGSDAPQAVPDSGNAEAPPQEATSADGVQGDGSAVLDVSREGGDTEGSELPLSPMGPSHSTAMPGQEDTHQWGQNGAASGGVGGDDNGLVSHPTISRLEAVLKSGDQDHSMEDAVPFAVGQTVRADASALLLIGVDADRSYPQTPHTGAEWISTGLAETSASNTCQGQRTREREGESAQRAWMMSSNSPAICVE